MLLWIATKTQCFNSSSSHHYHKQQYSSLDKENVDFKHSSSLFYFIFSLHSMCRKGMFFINSTRESFKGNWKKLEKI